MSRISHIITIIYNYWNLSAHVDSVFQLSVCSAVSIMRHLPGTSQQQGYFDIICIYTSYNFNHNFKPVCKLYSQRVYVTTMLKTCT